MVVSISRTPSAAAGWNEKRSRRSPAGPSSISSSPASLRRQILAQLRQRLALDLTHPLARQAEALADLLERLRLLVVQAEPHPQHRRLALVHLLQELHNVRQVVRLDHLGVRRL